MQTVFALLPLVAAFLAVPQFLPQLARVRRAGTTAGVSWSWAALTRSLENSAEVRRSRGTRVWRRRWRTHRVQVSGRLFRTRGMGSGCLAAISVPPRLQSLPTCRGTAYP